MLLGIPARASFTRPGWRGVVEEYRRFLPASSASAVTPLEGGTPLREAPRLSHASARRPECLKERPSSASVAYSLLGYFYLSVLPGWLGLDTQGFQPGIWEIARTVLIFLGIPLVAGFLTRWIGLKRRGRDWYERSFIPRIAPITLYGLLFTIVLLFAIQGDKITSQPLDVARIALPLLAYFAVMWVAGSPRGGRCKCPTPRPRASPSRSPRTTSSSRSTARWCLRGAFPRSRH